MSKHPAWKETRYAAQTAEKAITGLGRWATTDHTGTAKLLANLPPMGLIDTMLTHRCRDGAVLDPGRGGIGTHGVFADRLWHSLAAGGVSG